MGHIFLVGGRQLAVSGYFKLTAYCKPRTFFSQHAAAIGRLSPRKRIQNQSFPALFFVVSASRGIAGPGRYLSFVSSGMVFKNPVTSGSKS